MTQRELTRDPLVRHAGTAANQSRQRDLPRIAAFELASADRSSATCSRPRRNNRSAFVTSWLRRTVHRFVTAELLSSRFDQRQHPLPEARLPGTASA